MARLETELQRTYKKIEHMMEEGSDASRVKRFYSLMRHYEHLHERFVKVHGYAYNPVTHALNYQDGYAHD